MSSHTRHLDRYYVPGWVLDMAHAADQPGSAPTAATEAATIIKAYLRKDPPGVCRARCNAIEKERLDARAKNTGRAATAVATPSVRSLPGRTTTTNPCQERHP